MTAYDEGESITVSSTVIGLTDSRTSGRSSALITVETASVRFWPDQRVPSATVGTVLNPGDTLTLDSAATLRDIQFIRRASTDAVLRCSYGN